jgi:hypothetical protein
MTDSPAKAPTIADQVAFVDALKVATLIMSSGARGAIQASTVEILALARHLLRLQALADLTYEMLATADLLQAAADLDAKKALRREVTRKIDVVGASLEALGYGQQQPQDQQGKPEEEKLDGAE